MCSTTTNFFGKKILKDKSLTTLLTMIAYKKLFFLEEGDRRGYSSSKEGEYNRNQKFSEK